MRGKKLMAGVLLGVVLCLVPALGHGGIKVRAIMETPTMIDFLLLEARVNYIMNNPNAYLNVRALYDDKGIFRERFNLPKNIETKNKVLIAFLDSRQVYSYKSGTALLEDFKQRLEVFYSYIDSWCTSMDEDVIAKFFSKEGIPLGYFYQGEYYLWGED